MTFNKTHPPQYFAIITVSEKTRKIINIIILTKHMQPKGIKSAINKSCSVHPDISVSSNLPFIGIYHHRGVLTSLAGYL